MIDQDKVFRGLELCQGTMCAGNVCPYHNGDSFCTNGLHADALELLKEWRGVCDQILWERDVAISQLREIAKGLGERMDDIVALIDHEKPVPTTNKWNDFDPGLEYYECGYCKNAVRKPYRYCPFCGRRIEFVDGDKNKKHRGGECGSDS